VNLTLATTTAFIALNFTFSSTISASAANDGPTEPAYLYRAEVVRVIDADTIVVDIDLGFYTWIKNQRFRLHEIDAPNKGAPRKAGKIFLEKLIGDKEIIIRTFKSKDGDKKGKYGRWLGQIYLGGRDINQVIVDKGHARRCTFDKKSTTEMPKC